MSPFREGGFRPEQEQRPEAARRSPEMSRERLKELSTVEVEVETDLAPTLEALGRELGLQMQHREGGFHVTILGPAEKKLLDDVDDATLAELQAINEDLRNGVGIEVRGIGFIDGATAAVPAKDKQKKIAFLAVDVPAMNAFRLKLGLPPKDFHITLGFEGGDIHFALTGEKDDKGKEVTRPIDKKADPKFDALLASLPEIRFGGLSGEEKEKPKEKPADPAKEAKQRVKKALVDAGLGGGDLGKLLGIKGPEIGRASAAIEAAVNGGELAIEAPEEAKAEIARRIDIARGALGGT